MKRTISEEDVCRIHQTILRRAANKMRQRKYDDALRNLETAARWAYSLNVFYEDSETEHMIKAISGACIKRKRIKAKNQRFVLLDTEGLDNRGLTQQYIRAMEANRVEYLFITLRRELTPLSETIEEVYRSNYGHFMSIGGMQGKTYIEIAKAVSDSIVAFQPSRVLLHLMPWDVVSLLAIYSVEGVIVYNINLTDHAFWLGVSFVDYNIEFRPYGKTISLQKRNINPERILELPFYPILPVNCSFSGLPVFSKGTVVIFTGGQPYKMTDEHNTFFQDIIDNILSLSPKAVVCVAGFEAESDDFNIRVGKMKHKDRIYNIGVRKDINEVYKHVDIYLQTYPFNGGLMSQYAVMNKLPILTFTKREEIDGYKELIDHFGEAAVCFCEMDEFLNYAKKLINNSEFRRLEGEKAYHVMMNAQKFNLFFSKVILNNEKYFNWMPITIDYEQKKQSYLSLAKAQGYETFRILTKAYGGNSFFLFPKYWNILARFMGCSQIIYELKVFLYRCLPRFWGK